MNASIGEKVGPRPNPAFLAVLIALALVASGCGLTSSGPPDSLAFDDQSQQVPSNLQADRLPTIQSVEVAPLFRNNVAVPPVPLGSQSQPFVELRPSPAARAIETPSGVVMPVLGETPEAWLAMSACESVRFVARNQGTPIDRAHVVLDPGHGGTEVGAVGRTGLTEASLNLQVALRARRLLEAEGATVVLTRTTDHNLTVAARGYIVQAIRPALFVSIHHNGGAPRLGAEPGTMVFAKADHTESKRFGGLFFEELVPAIAAAAEPDRIRYEQYAAALAIHEAQIEAYDRSVQERIGALITNGQLPADLTTTTPPPQPEADGVKLPSQRSPSPTTTLATTTASVTVVDTNGSDKTSQPTAPTTTVPATTVPVPDTVALPPPFELEPVPAFGFAGSGAAEFDPGFGLTAETTYRY